MTYYTSVIILVLLALGVLTVLISENNRIPLRKKHLFIATNMLIALSAIAECAGLHIGGNPDIPSWVLTVVKAVDYTVTPLTGGALIAIMEKKSIRKMAIHWLFIANAVFQLVSAFTGWMVVIDENNNYTHGPLYPVYMGIYFIVLAILAIELILYGKTFRKQNRISLYATTLLIFVGILMQEILGRENRVAYLGLTFGAAFLFIHYSEFAQMKMDDQITEQRGIISRDALTGAYSRFAYIDAMNTYAEDLPKDLAVFLLDVNGLKLVNDSLGHEAGDELICGAARCIESTLGKDGRTFRIGGDEYVVLTLMTKEQADAAMDDFQKTTAVWTGAKAKSLSVSVGYALAKDFPNDSVEALAREADKAMYKQKMEYYQKNGIERRKAAP